MKKFDRKIKGALVILSVLLIVFVGFSKAGILFSTKDDNIITVSTSNKVLDPRNYVASIINVEKENEEIKETVETTVTSSTTVQTTVPTTVQTTNVVTTTTSTEVVTTLKAPYSTNGWTGEVLTPARGVVYGPTGKETYYNLDLTKIIIGMRNMGFSEEEYPYWIRDDGVKMLGNYVIVAAALYKHPRGSFVESSLGTAIVCDTGGFAKNNPDQLDIAVTWK